MSSAHPEGASGAEELNVTHEATSFDQSFPSENSVENMVNEREAATDQDENTEKIAQSSHAPSGRNHETSPEATSRGHGGDGIPGVALVLVGGAIAAGLYLFKKFLSSKSSDDSSEAVTKQLFLEHFHHETPSVTAAATSAPSPTLTEKRLVVSDRIDIQGIKTRFGSSEWQASNKVCTVSSPLVDQLVWAGAVVIGTLPTWPLGLNPSFSSSEIPSEKHQSRMSREIAAISNPGAPKGHTHGGGEYGPAVAIAAGAADVCIAVDEVGSALIPAACCGVYAYRPTSGVLQLEGAAIASSTLGTTCLLAADPVLLLRAAKALNVPGGGSDTAGIVSKYLVAEDLFALCDEELKNCAPAVVAAVKRWAGPEHAQGLAICDWLYHRIPSLTEFMPRKRNQKNNYTNNNEEEETGYSKRTLDVLHALTAAADAIRKWEWLRSPSGRWAWNKHRHATSAVSSIASGMSENESRKATELPQEIIAGLLDAHHVTEKMYSNAISVADELSRGMRAALQEGYVFVVPTTPGPAPKTSGKNSERDERQFRKLSEQFASLASLAGIPQIVMPMPSPASGQNTGKKAPLSISMVTLQRRDLILVKAAAKLGPMLKEEVAKLAASIDGTSSSGGAKDKNSAGESGSSSGRKRKGNVGVIEENAHAAERSKEEGNAAFKAGRYNEAVKRYSEAIQYNPQIAVYFSNRAMAYLKLGSYTSAEADCDAALELDPSMVKALLRRGSAQLAQGRLIEARKDFERVLYLEPRNKQAIEELKRLKDIEAPDSADY